MSLRESVSQQSDSLLWTLRAEVVFTTNLQPLVFFSAVSPCLFKDILLCARRYWHAFIDHLETEKPLHTLRSCWLPGPALNRDRKGLKSGWTWLQWCLQSPGAVWESSAFWSRTQGPIKVEEEKKGSLGGSTYWKHGQPTASTTAFFWSWLSFAVLLKFHKYSNIW